MRFFSILKPGIIFGNLVTACGGFFLGSTPKAQAIFGIPNSLHGFDFKLLLWTLIGLALIVGSGCVFNNLIDRDIDGLMQRTCDRVLVKGLIRPDIAFFYGLLLGFIGFAILHYFSTLPALIAAIIGWVFYVFVYSLILKRRSTLGTILGGISGAIPPVVGYCSASGKFDLGAVLFFLILLLWQMPHFYAIAIYRLKDFKSAKIPVLPAIKSMNYTRVSMLIYVVFYGFCTLLPTLFSYTGWFYFICASVLSLCWIFITAQGMALPNDSEKISEKTSEKLYGSWARKVFLFSILNITLLCVALGIDLLLVY